MALTPEQEQMLVDKYSTTNPLAQVMQVAQHLPQEQAAKILRYATATGESPIQVANNLHVYERDVIDKIDWDKVLQQNPKTYAYLNNPLHMAIAKDKKQIEHLTNFEQNFKALVALKNGLKNLARDKFGLAYGISETVRDIEKQVDDSLIFDFAKNYSWVSGLKSDTSNKILHDIVYSETLKRKNVQGDSWLAQLGLDFMEGVPQIFEQVGLGIATRGIGITTAMMGTQIAGGEYLKLKEDGVPNERALTASSLSALGQLPFEALSLSRLLKVVPGDKMWGNLVKAGLTEGATEWLQNYPAAMAEIWAKNPEFTAGQYGEAFINDFWEITQEGAYQGLVAIPLGMLGGSINIAVQKRANAKYNEYLENQQQLIRESPIAKVSPEFIEKLSEAVTDGSKVYIDPEAMQLFQSENPKIVESMGITEQDIREAVETGQRIEIAEGVYNLVAAQNPTVQQALRDDITIDEYSLTNREASQIDQKELYRAAEQIRKEQTELDEVNKQTSDNMRDAAIPKQQANDLLVMLTPHAKTMGDAMGKTPAQWMRDHGPIFRRGTAPVDGAMNQAAMYRNPVETITEFRDFVLANKGNPKETNKSYFTFKTASGPEVSITFSEMTHIDEGHKLSDEQWQAIVGHLDNVEYAYTDKQKGKKDGKPVLLKINTPLGKAGVVLEFLPNGRIFINTAFFDSDMNIDNWAKQKSPIVLGPKVSVDTQGAPINQHSYGNSSINNIQQSLGIVNQDSMQMFQPLNNDVDPNTKVNVVDITEALPKEFVSNKDLLGHVRGLIKNNTALSTADKKAIMEILPKDARHIVYSSRKVGGRDIVLRRGSLLSIGDLMQNAVLIESIPNKKIDKKPGISVYHRFYVPILFKKKLYTVRLVAEERKGDITINPANVNLYDIIIENKETLPANQPTSQSESSGLMPAKGSLDGNSVPPALTASKSSYVVAGSTKKVTKYHPKLTIREMLDSVKDADGTRYFSDNRGMIHRENGRAIITLFENADASTLIHEMVGHYFTQNLIEYGALDTAPEWMKKDRQKMLEYAGIEDWETATKEQRIQAHEKWANTAERYIMEGKAPSKELRSVFKRFKDWMMAIYKTIRAIGGKVDPQIAEVFDRMLASEAEIAQVAAVEGYLRRLPDAIYDNLPETVRRDMENQLDRVKEQAEARVRGKVMPFIQADNKLRMAEERQAARERIAEEVEKEPVYEATAQIREQVGGNVQEIAEAYHNFMIDEEKGLAFDMIANMQGFSSGDELAVRILQGPTLAEEINARLDAHMRQFRDILLDKAAIDAEIREAMHSDEGALLLAAELQIIQEKLGEALSREESRQQTKIRKELARQAAQKDIAAMPLEEAMRLRTWFAGRQRAAEKAATALAKKRFDEAAEWKAIQLYNHCMVMESLQARRQFEKTNRYLKKQQKADRDTWKKEEHFVQAADILRRFGFTHKALSPGMKEETLAEWAERMDETMDAVEIAPWLFSEQGEKPMRQLTLGEVKDIENALRNIKHLARKEYNFGKLFDKAEITEIANELIAQLESQGLMTSPEFSQRLDTAKKMLQAYQDSKQVFITPETICRVLDGGEDFGVFWRAFIQPVYESSNLELEWHGRVIEKLKAITDLYTDKERNTILERKFFIPELQVSMTKGELIMIGLNRGNPENWRVMVEGMRLPGVVEYFPQFKETWTAENLHNVLETYLNDTDLKFIRGVWDLYAGMKPEYFEMDKRYKGFAPKEVEVGPFMFRGEMVPGGYFPLVKDNRFGPKDDRNESKDSILEVESPFRRATTNRGRLKARTGAVYPVLLDLNIVQRTLVDSIRDLTHRETIADLNALLNNQQLSIALNNALGRNGVRFFDNWLKAVSGTLDPATAKTGPITKASKWLRRNTVVSILGAKLSVLMQTPTAISTMHYAAKSLGLNNTIHSLVSFYSEALTNPSRFNAMVEEVLKESPEMRTRDQNLDVSIAEVYVKAFEGESKIGKLARVSMATHGMVDRLLTIPFWREAKKMQLKKGASEKDAIAFADMAVRRAFGSGLVKDRPMFQRNAHEAVKWISMFTTYMNAQVNMAYEQGATQIRWEASAIPQAFGMLTAFVIFPAVVGELLSFRWPDEDEDEVKYWTKKIASYPFTAFPVVRDVADMTLSKALGLPYYGVKPAPISGALEAGGNAIGKLFEDDATWADKLESASVAATFFAGRGGIPKQFVDWFWNLYDYSVNDMDAELRDLFRRRPKRER